MRPIPTFTLLLACAAQAAAHESSPRIDVPDSAKAASAAVDAFFAALSAGDLDRAGAQLDESLVVLESGGAEHSAAEYLGGHAKSDAEFLKGSHHVLRRRTARASGDVAWVASESDLHVEKDGKPMVLASAETMVLRSGQSGWKIVHIHWSSHVVRPDEAH
jgi:ketosteroid isomerase-like protein